MSTLPHPVQVAAEREPYIYAFYRLAKLHQVPTGHPENFLELARALRSQPEFHAGVFRLAASIRSTEPGIKLTEVIAILALAVGGRETVSAEPVQVRSELLDMFTAAFGPDRASSSELTTASEPPPNPTTERAASAAPFRLPAPFPITGPPRAISPLPEAAPADSPSARRPPIPQQALLADPAPNPISEAPPLPYLDQTADPDVTGAPAFGAVPAVPAPPAKPPLEQRVEDLEHRLTDVVQELQTLPSRIRAVPALAIPDASNSALTLSDEPVPFSSPPSDEGVYASHHRGGPAVSGRGTCTRITQMLLPLLLLLAVAGIAAAYLLTRPQSARSSRALAAAQSVRPPGSAPIPPAEPKPPAGTPVATHPSAGGLTSGPQSTDPESEVAATLEAWAAAAAANDPVSESGYYAPTVDRYFLQRNVSRQFVLHDKQAYRQRGNRIQSFSIGGLGFQSLEPDSAVVTLTKFWSVTGPEQTGFPHTTHTRLWLARTAEGWKITGEQDIRPSAD